MKKILITDLILRDAHQSLLATRMLTSDMLGIAEKLNRAGYWSLEVWGGATFDSCIRYLNEDPWERIRKLKKAMPDTPMQMLLRGQNILGYRNYADDVVEMFVERASFNGVDVFRVFDALNDARNLKTAIKAVKKHKKHAQASVSYTISPIHTIDMYVKLAKELENMGADSLCIKDMAALLKPYTAFELVRALKRSIDIPVHVHSHATTGMSVATLIKSVEAGADILDTAISSLAMGTSHSPTETIVEILHNTEYDTGLDVRLLVEIAAYFREVRKKYHQFESSFTGADTRILLAQVPGGMLSNLEKQLKDQNAIERIDDVLEEIARVQKDFGYPPLVTPTSQIVGTQAVFNVLFGRYKNLTGESRDLLAGKYGRTPGNADEELVERALDEMGLDSPVGHRPADDIPNELDRIEDELKGKMGLKKVAMEDVLTYALFPQVALNFFKSRDMGPVNFEKKPELNSAIPAETALSSDGERRYIVNVDGKDFKVHVKRDENGSENSRISPMPLKKESSPSKTNFVQAQIAGTVMRLNYNNGDAVSENDTIIVMESMKMELEVKTDQSGKIKYMVKPGDTLQAEQKIAEIS